MSPPDRVPDVEVVFARGTGEPPEHWQRQEGLFVKRSAKSFRILRR